MGDSILSRHLAELGKKGGKARLKTMTAEQRTASARKAGLASAAARVKKAKQKKTKAQQS
jgi:hypothetical protein